ncbi:MAG: ergothioneine biosynthesis protein EgtB [Actinomycetota bacterium]
MVEASRSSYREVRALSEALCRPLATEDYVVQSMPDVSPPKWHLAHTTWFWETFLLIPNAPAYRPFDPRYGYLFNSYYEAVGDRHPRAERGLLSRPTVAETYAYRAHVDEAMHRLLETALDEPTRALIELGLNHEQQHQELLITDLKHILGANPLRPAYLESAQATDVPAPEMRWLSYPGGLLTIGRQGGGFAFDNESPRHQVYALPYRLASRLVTNGEYLQFMSDGGYNRAELWLSEGWATVQQQRWRAPLYWETRDDEWWSYTLGGLRRVSRSEPVCHVSYFEADAFARWAGKRLPTEFEWESAAAEVEPVGNLLDAKRLHVGVAENGLSTPAQLFGDVWEWTASPYVAYPGFRPASGAVGEYNGKFMCNQYVLRGGSCATPPGHVRATYRNFFPPAARWQFSGLRLADEA